MLKYNKYDITFTTQKPSDKLDVNGIIKAFGLEKVNIKREYKRIKNKDSLLTITQQNAVKYLYTHLYLNNLDQD